MEQAPIIVIKRKKHAHAHHGGAWKVAYADFVTAMMALFIVLWLLSSSEQVQKAVGGYFTDPTGSGKQIGNGLRGIGGESLTVVNQADMAKLKEKLDQAVKQTGSLQKMKEHVTMTVTGEGLRVELTEGNQAGFFFQSGSPDPSGEGKEMLSTLAAEIGKMPNPVIIEGHTDNKALAKKDYTNWELSTDRANTARRWMEQNGMRPDQVIQVRGFADQKPRDATSPDDPSNRRITVIIQNPESQTGFGASGAPGATAAPKSSPVPAKK
ncbi:MAG TPA: flagellar motor protein MotB [Bryobacteraceae bacterium]|jgi:chemotaxis protein MotB|nr:flagellar motor protein MotB [Bryobacteraceae bacterium]